jgi:hypothetical protein
MDYHSDKYSDKYLDKSLHKINNEIDLFNPRNKILNRNFNQTSNSILKYWMEKYCIEYHQLVFEFNPSKLKIKMQNSQQNKIKAKPSLEILLEELFTNYSDEIDKINFNNQIISEFKNIFKNKKSNSTIINHISELLNLYGEQIYNSTQHNNIIELSFIEALQKLLGNTNNTTTNNTNNTNTRNTRFKKIIKLIIDEFKNANYFIAFKIQLEMHNGFNYLYTYNDDELEFILHSHKEINPNALYWRFLYARMKSVFRTYVKGTKNDKKEVDNKMKFEIYLSDQLKQLPRKGKMFGPVEINSGSTNFETITIWRNEEHFKLILHELVHFYNLDGYLDLEHQNQQINMECHYQIEKNTETRLYEAYTESLAVFMNSFANAYQIYLMEMMNRNKSNKSNKNNINLEWKELNKSDLEMINQIRNQLWLKEKKFFLVQIAKIFLHLNPESTNFADFLIIPEKCKQLREHFDNKNQLKEKTSTLSYHILKGANMLFDQEFLESLQNPLIPHPKSLYKFYQYIIEKTHNNDFINMVNQAIQFIKDRKHYDKNLRMTLYQTELGV